MTIKREVIESPIQQGMDEVISYTLDTSPWGGTPSAPEITIYDYTNRVIDESTDITNTVMPTNTPQVDGDIIQISPLLNLELNKRYRMNIVWVSAGNSLSTYCIINVER